MLEYGKGTKDQSGSEGIHAQNKTCCIDPACVEDRNSILLRARELMHGLRQGRQEQGELFRLFR